MADDYPTTAGHLGACQNKTTKLSLPPSLPVGGIVKLGPGALRKRMEFGHKLPPHTYSTFSLMGEASGLPCSIGCKVDGMTTGSFSPLSHIIRSCRAPGSERNGNWLPWHQVLPTTWSPRQEDSICLRTSTWWTDTKISAAN